MLLLLLLLEQGWPLLVPSSSSSSSGSCRPCECSDHGVKAIAAWAGPLLHLLLHLLLLLLLFMRPVLLLHVLQLSSRGSVSAEQPRAMGMHASSSSSSSLRHIGVLRCQLPLLPHHHLLLLLLLLLLLPLCCVHLQQYNFSCPLYCLQSIYEHFVSRHEHGLRSAAVACSVQSG
jgi:hypothetical protein